MSVKIHRLSKSRFVAGLHCERRLWMLVNQPQDKREPTLAEQKRMQTGTAFGREVTTLFRGGVEITADHAHPQEALDETAVQLAGDAPALFEAAFLYHQVLVRVDILKRSETTPNAWELIEVKSASNSTNNPVARDAKLKKHFSDLAVQLYVLEGAGITVNSISLAWVNSTYRRTGDLDWNQLVAIEDHSEEARARAATVGTQIDQFLTMIDQSESPQASYGKTKCGDCEFNRSCWGDEPEDSIIHLPFIHTAKLEALEALGVKRIPQIPGDFNLSRSQTAALEAYSHPRGKLVEREPLEQWLESLVYPISYLDFETWNPCVPPFDEMSPYTQIPFQYSIHIQEKRDGPLIHCPFLAEATGDPRPKLIEQLVGDIKPTGSIVVHHASFESGRIRELADFSPTHANELMAMLDRIVDTEIPFKGNWYVHPGLKGRSSIKVVLPTLVSDCSYEGMAISDGLTASIKFEEMHRGAVVEHEVESIRKDLTDYCKMDTFAMTRIVERLWELVR